MAAIFSDLNVFQEFFTGLGQFWLGRKQMK